MQKTLKLLPILAVALVLSACGGSEEVVIIEPVEAEPTFSKF